MEVLVGIVLLHTFLSSWVLGNHLLGSFGWHRFIYRSGWLWGWDSSNHRTIAEVLGHWPRSLLL